MHHPTHLRQARGRARLGPIRLSMPGGIVKVDDVAARDLGRVIELEVIVLDSEEGRPGDRFKSSISK